MSHVSREEAKSFSKIYFDDKDTEVDLLIDAAEGFVAKFLNRDSLSDTDLLVNGNSPPADSPGSEELLPTIKLLVLQQFNESWQNREIQVIGTIIQENPSWMRAAHLYRKNLGV